MDLDNISNISASNTSASSKLSIDSSLTNTDDIHNFTKINPTLWKVFIDENITKQKTPWTLAFAEAFDPLWQAQLYQNGSQLQVSNSKPLYGAINGFEINPDLENSKGEGNLEIVIKYLPQELFETGIKISLLILCLIIVFIVSINLIYRIKK
jgi:hypothetical protein